MCASPPLFPNATGRVAQATKEFTSEISPSVTDMNGKEILRLSMGRLLTKLTEVRGAGRRGGAGRPTGLGVGRVAWTP